MRAGMVLEVLAARYEVWLLVPQLYLPWRTPVPDAIVRLCRAAVVLPGPVAPMPASSFSWLGRKRFRLPRSSSNVLPNRVQKEASALRGIRFDIVHVFRLAMHPFAQPYFAAIGGRAPKRHMDLDDIESIVHRDLAVLYRSNGMESMARCEEIEAGKCLALEDKALSDFDRVYVCSRGDRDRLRERSNTELCVLPNAVHVPKSLPPRPVGQPFTFLFVGTLGYYPNEDAARYFCSEIIPRIRRRSARKFRVNIVGTGASDALRQIATTSGAQLVGKVPDVGPFYGEADAVVVPIRAGGGTRIKVLEAFAYMRPVVSTSLGIDGIDAQDRKHLLVGDTSDSLEDCCAQLMSDPKMAEQLSKDAFDLLLHAYTADTMKSTLASFP